MKLNECTDNYLCLLIQEVGYELRNRGFSIGGGIHALCEGYIHNEDGKVDIRRVIECLGSCELTRVRYVSQTLAIQENAANKREVR